MATKSRRKPPKKAEGSLWKVAFFILFVGFVGGAIIWMIVINPPQKRLNCGSSFASSLTYIGNCSEE